MRSPSMADEAGIEFMLPVGRWKGYGGDTDYMGTTLETITWATGLLATTKRLTVFGTVHAPLFHPLIAAKQFVTADHIGEGRFGLNIVVGWNEDEFQMFGVHAARARAALRLRPGMDRRGQDGLGAAGRFRLRRPVHQAEEGPRQAQAVRRHAAADHERRRLADRPRLRDPQLRRLLHPGRRAPRWTRPRSACKAAKDEAQAHGRELDVYTVGVVTCRPTQKEAEEYYHYATIENADWSAVDGILGKKNISAATVGEEEFQQPAPPLRQRHGRPADGRRSRPDRADARRPEPRRPARHRLLVRQLSQGAAVLLRRGAAAARAHGHPREAEGQRAASRRYDRA